MNLVAASSGLHLGYIFSLRSCLRGSKSLLMTKYWRGGTAPVGHIGQYDPLVQFQYNIT